ncbi:MAG: GntR family transcriptional regulator [Terriglobia bacterium]
MQQLVTERLRRAILDGTFKLNEKLNQSELAQKLNVSRIPTREALRTLEAEGLVKFHPHRGAVVATISQEEIKEVYEIRILLEVRAALGAMKRINPEQLRHVKSLQQQMVRTTDLDQWVLLNDRFHLGIYEASGWTRLQGVIQMLRNLTAPYVRLYVTDRFDRDSANTEHATIVEALEKRDSAAMRNSLKRHLAHACDGIISHLNRGNRPRGVAKESVLVSTD